MSKRIKEYNRIEKYREIMDQYYSGKLGKPNLYLFQILFQAGYQNLLNEMTYDELSQLISETSNIYFKTALIQARNKKINLQEDCYGS